MEDLRTFVRSVFAIIISSSTPPGTKTIYKTDDPYKPNSCKRKKGG
jgi:hypothetical protein